MDPFTRPNPFTRDTFIIPTHTRTPPIHNIYPSPSSAFPTNNHQPSEFAYSRPYNNPFERSHISQVSDRNKYHSESKVGIREGGHRYMGTFLPLSRVENRLRLRDLDPQNWKRQQQEQEQNIVDCYGVEALRYSNYSTVPSSVNYDLLPKRNPQTQMKRYDSATSLTNVEKLDKPQLDRKITFEPNSLESRQSQAVKTSYTPNKNIEHFHDELEQPTKKYRKESQHLNDIYERPSEEYYTTTLHTPNFNSAPSNSQHSNAPKRQYPHHEESFSKDLAEMRVHPESKMSKAEQSMYHHSEHPMQYESFNYGDPYGDSQRKRGPLNGMLFSEEDDYILEGGKSRYKQMPYSIEYLGQSYFQINIL